MKDLSLNHIIWHSSYNTDVHAEFLEKSFVRKMMVFSVYGVWSRGTPGLRGFWGCGSLSVKTRKVPGKPGWVGAPMCTSLPRWLIKAFPGSPTSYSTDRCEFSDQVGPKLNCSKRRCFGGVSSVPFFGICSSFSEPLVVERPDVFFLP